jgi:hypothetical protein
MLEVEGKKAGILTFQSRFLPDWKTSNTFHIIEDTSRLKAPEAYIHYKSLLELELQDRFNFKVPLGNFVIKDNEYTNFIKVGNEAKTRPMILKPIENLKREIRQIE